MLRVGLIGYGYWGPNLARVFNGNPDCALIRIAETDAKRRLLASTTYPHVDVVQDGRIVEAEDLDAVLIATPPSTHYRLAKQALENGKHVWVEKPMTSTSEQGEELIRLADEHKCTLMVDHTFLFTSAVRKMKALIDGGDLGDLYYYDSVRVNLGLLQHDSNVIWDLATHDFSIMDYLLGPAPKAVAAQGRGHFQTGFEDVAYVSVFYDDDLMAHFHVNWLSPVKLRRTIVSGSKKMLVWDDLNPDERIKIYDKGAEVLTQEGKYGIQASYRAGDMTTPALPHDEALQTEAEYFVECIRDGLRPFNDGRAGLRVVRLLEATDRSLKAGGTLVEL